MTRPKVMIAVPTLSMVHTEFMSSILALDTDCADVHVAIEANSLVYDARNHLCMKAYEDCKADYVLWIDSDMVFEPDIISRFLKHMEDGKEFVCGIYFARKLPTSPVIAKEIKWDQDKNNTITHDVTKFTDYPKDQVFEIAGCGLACCMMSTKLIFETAAAFGMSPFEPLPGLSEDYSFCWRIGKRGIKMYCDSTIKVGHVGTYLFTEKTWLNQEKRKENK